MKPRSALVNLMAITDPEAPPKVCAADLDRTIAYNSAPMPLDACPREAAHAATELGAEPERYRAPLEPLFDRYPRGSTAVMLVLLVLCLGLVGVDAPEDEATAAAAAQELADEQAALQQMMELAALAASEGQP